MSLHIDKAYDYIKDFDALIEYNTIVLLQNIINNNGINLNMKNIDNNLDVAKWIDFVHDYIKEKRKR